MTDPSYLKIYEDPLTYDLESGEIDLAGSILLKLAQEAAGSVLELGCGTGRVTIPLAQAGIPITGLDVTPGMLARAQAKSPGLPITWVEADVRSFRLDHSFKLIFTRGAVFQHLLQRSDQEAFLTRVKEHLAPDGCLLLDIGFKPPPAMIDVPEEQDWYRYEDQEGREWQVTGTDAYDHINQLWIQTSYRRLVGETEGSKQPSPERLVLRYFMPQEIEAQLAYNGFTVLERFGDWNGNPLAASSFMQIYLCEWIAPV